jgi:signal transduction histidine kinase
MPPLDKRDAELKKLRKENARLRGDLLTIGRRISHDLRTPLGGISISVELIRQILDQNDAATDAIRSLNVSADELDRLVKSLSTVAKAAAASHLLKKIAMGDIIHSVLAQLERKALERGASIKITDSWPEVAGEPDWLEFIWWNFLNNSLQHGGSNIQLGWSDQKDHHRFWIHDDGQGVGAEISALLFQPFDSLHRLDSTRGLGLSIVERLVDLQGGRCGYESDTGSRFYFTLPKAN